MKRTATEVLNIIEEVLLQRDQEAADLWNILTALRGPDVDDSCATVKFAVTAPIRAVVFPRVYAGTCHWRAGGPIHPAGAIYVSPKHLRPDASDNVPGYHFRDHVSWALSALRRVRGFRNETT